MPNTTNRTRAHALIAEAQQLAKSAEAAGRDFTPEERGRVAGLFAEAKELTKNDQDAGDAALRSQVDELGRGTGPLSASAVNLANPAGGSMPGRWAKAFVENAPRTGRGQKDAVVPSGSVTVPALTPDIAPLQDRPATFLSAVTSLSLDTGSFKFARESVRTNNAASVLPGHLKPTSVVELEGIEESAKVVAHLVGPVDRSLLDDATEVGLFLQTVMLDGLTLAIEQMVISGDPTVTTRDDFAGIEHTSGVQTQAFATDALTSIRDAITKLQNSRLAGPFLIVMNPDDWATLELLKSTEPFTLGAPGAQGPQLPINSATQSLWGVRVALSLAVEVGTAIVGDFGASSIRLREREEATMTWSDAMQLPIVGGEDGATATGFELNRLMFRAETRVGLELRRPQAFVITALAA